MVFNRIPKFLRIIISQMLLNTMNTIEGTERYTEECIENIPRASSDLKRLS